MPKVSIIVPNYNHSKFLEKRLDSIFNQTYKDFEIILLDDCSTDDSLKILNEYVTRPNVSYLIVNKKNSGSTFKQWKRGIELAKGEYVWIAESDDWATNDFLSQLVKELDEDSQLGIAYCQSYIVDENDNIVCDNLSWTSDLDDSRWSKVFVNDGINEIESYLCKKNTIPNASAVLFRKRYLQFKSIPTKMKIAGDWLVWIKILSKSKVFYTSECLNYFRDTSTSTRIHNTKQKRLLAIKEEVLVLKLIKKTLLKANPDLNKIHNKKIVDFINTISLSTIFSSFFWTYCVFKKPITSIRRIMNLLKNTC